MGYLKCFYILFMFFLFSFFAQSSEMYAQTNVETFGQNRVQYKRFTWKFLEAKHFKIYHYDKAGTDLARYVAEQAEQDVTAVENRLGGKFPDYLNIFVYNSYSDFQQSNIGYEMDGELENNTAGKVNILGDKLVIYFTGNHHDLKQQLRRGIAQVVMERILFGENVREMVRNSTLLNLPRWATDGYIGYVVEGWTSEMDNQWKNLLADTSKRIFFDEIAMKHPEVAGRAFWKYIDEKYGENNVKNVLYLTQLKSSLNAALKISFGVKERAMYDSVINFYKDLYRFQSPLFDAVDTSAFLYAIPKPKDGSRIREIFVSPRGFDIAYVKWNKGEYKVMLQKTSSDSKHKTSNATFPLLSGGVLNHVENDDPNYPLLAWSNTGYKLGIIYNYKNRLRIKIYDAIKGKTTRYTIPENRFDRVLSVTFMEDDDMIVLSAIRKGQSDLFEYRLKGGRMTQVTDDAWDDLQPIFVSGGSRKGIVFLSNRTEPFINIKPLPNELPGGQMNAFFYNATTKSMDLLPITRWKNGAISHVIPYGFDNFAFLSDVSGVSNRYAVIFGRDKNNMDSAYAVPVTNYERSILSQQYNAASQKVAEVIEQPDKYAVYFRPVELPPPDGNFEPKQPLILPQIDALSENRSRILFYDSQTSNERNSKKNRNDEKNNKERKWIEVKSGSAYQSDFDTPTSHDILDSVPKIIVPESQQFAQKLSIKNPSDTVEIVSSSDKIRKLEAVENDTQLKKVMYVDSTFIQMKSQRYRSGFRLNTVSARLDNTVLFNRYQSYTGNVGTINNPPLGGMVTVQLIDKLEDYRFTGGFRLPVDFSSATYLLQFQNLRRRVDWGLTFLRNEEKRNYRFQIGTNTGAQIVDELGKTTLHLFQGSASYPFDKTNSIRMNMGFREDRMVIKANDIYGLILPSMKEYWALSRAEFVHDDTENPTLNIWKGARYKVFAEYMFKFYSDNKYYQAPGGFDSTKLGGFYNVGLDFRYYVGIYKNFIGAIRVAGAHSGGNKQIKYMLGGVDNPIRPKQGTGLQVSDKNTYAFQALETNLRGYPQNARNGNTFGVLNAELRFPVFGTLMRRPMNFTMAKHLQIVAFLDAGSAWEGLLPSDDKVRSQTLYWPDQYNPSVTVNIPMPTYSFGVGYGVGLRTMLFGYFLRADAAWNIEKDFQFHFSLGTDF